MAAPEEHQEVTLAPTNHMNIKEVRRTANDALLSKLSASIRGYFHDDFLHHFSFPLMSEYEALILPDFTQQHAHITANGTLPFEQSPFPILDKPDSFQNTPYAVIKPGNDQSGPMMALQNPLLSQATITPQQQSNLDLTFPKPLQSLSNHALKQPPAQPQFPNPLLSSPTPSIKFTSVLPPSILPHIEAPIPKSSLPRRSPLINKGYACRVHALDKIIVDFIQTCEQQGKKSQILSIGAGYDTSYFRLKYHHNIKPTQYVELDFPHTIAHKANLINHPHNSALLKVINSYSPNQFHAKENYNRDVNSAQNDPVNFENMYTTFVCPTQKQSNAVVASEGGELNQSPGTTKSALFTPMPTEIEKSQQQSTPFTISYHDYSLIGCDGRDVSSLQKCLEKTLWNPNYPTLMLFECVLVYIPPLAANDMLQTLIRMHNNVTMVTVYEQMHPNDPFGRTMMTNLHQRGCPLLSLPTYPDLQQQLQRFKNFGFQTFTGWSLAQIAQHFTPCPGVEILDEVEEYQLMSSHYTVFIALKDPSQNIDQIEGTVDELPNPQEQGDNSTSSSVETRNKTEVGNKFPPQSTHVKPYYDLTEYSPKNGPHGKILTIRNENGANTQCTGDYDWCTSILDPKPYQYIPNYHPSVKVKAEKQGERLFAFEKVGFMGCFPPSYEAKK
jgi:hypothetical protein